MVHFAIIGLICITYSFNAYSNESLFDGVDDYYNEYYLEENTVKSKSKQSSLSNDGNILPVSYSNTGGKKTVVVSIKNQSFSAYDSSGYLVKSGRVSTAKRGYKTKRGTFRNLQKRGGSRCWSYKYDVGIPYCIFYSGGFALHGYHDVPDYPASRGCIRMLVDDARWLHNSFIDGSTVLIVR